MNTRLLIAVLAYGLASIALSGCGYGYYVNKKICLVAPMHPTQTAMAEYPKYAARAVSPLVGVSATVADSFIRYYPAPSVWGVVMPPSWAPGEPKQPVEVALPKLLRTWVGPAATVASAHMIDGVVTAFEFYDFDGVPAGRIATRLTVSRGNQVEFERERVTAVRAGSIDDVLAAHLAEWADDADLQAVLRANPDPIQVSSPEVAQPIVAGDLTSSTPITTEPIVFAPLVDLNAGVNATKHGRDDLLSPTYSAYTALIMYIGENYVESGPVVSPEALPPKLSEWLANLLRTASRADVQLGDTKVDPKRIDAGAIAAFGNHTRGWVVVPVVDELDAFSMSALSAATIAGGKQETSASGVTSYSGSGAASFGIARTDSFMNMRMRVICVHVDSGRVDRRKVVYAMSGTAMKDQRAVSFQDGLAYIGPRVVSAVVNVLRGQ